MFGLLYICSPPSLVSTLRRQYNCLCAEVNCTRDRKEMACGASAQAMSGCVAGVPCLTVVNQTSEPLAVSGVLGATTYCAQVGASASAGWSVPSGSAWQIVGASTGVTYVARLYVFGDLSETVAPPSGVGVDYNCKPMPWGALVGGWAAVSGAAYWAARKTPTQLQTAALRACERDLGQGLCDPSVAAGYLAPLRKANLKRAAFWALAPALAALAFLLLWLRATGRWGGQVTCVDCHARGPTWNWTQRSRGAWDRASCRLFGICACRSPMLEQNCASYARAHPELDISYSVTRAQRRTSFSCSCYEGRSQHYYDCSASLGQQLCSVCP